MSGASAMPAPAAAARPTVRALDDGTGARWDAYVEAAPGATFFHRAGWRLVLERAFRHTTYFLYAESAGRITGVLPLAHVRSRLFGNALISTPFCVYGGVVADDDASRDALLEAACHRAETLGVDYLELRGREPQHPDWPTKDLYVTFRKTIDPDHEKNLLAIPKKQRAIVRKGIRSGLVSRKDSTTGDLYEAYSESVRNLGTPVFSRQYLDVLCDVFGKDCEILSVVHDGRVVGSVMSFYFRDEVLPYYGGGTGEARALRANDFMYWELMRDSADRGIRVFDYGRSKVDTGSYRFKKHWGFEPEPLCYQYYLVRATAMPNLSPTNPRYRLFISAWKRLPVSVARWLGPYIARYLG